MDVSRHLNIDFSCGHRCVHDQSQRAGSRSLRIHRQSVTDHAHCRRQPFHPMHSTTDHQLQELKDFFRDCGEVCYADAHTRKEREG